MPAVPFAIGAYRRRYGNLPELRLLNMFVEKSPANPGEQVVLQSRPGLAQHYTIGSGPIAGVFQQPGTFGGAIFSVSGGSLYRDNTSIGSATGPNRARWAAIEDEVAVCRGGRLFVYDGSGTEQASFPNDENVVDILFLAGRYVGIAENSQIYYVSDLLDAKTWDASRTGVAEQLPDNIVGGAVVGDRLWLFGERGTEVHYSTGSNTQPFARVQGQLYDKGCLARDTIVSLDNSVMWVGHDFMVYRGGQVPQRISDHGVEEDLRKSDPVDLRAWSYVLDGHTHYVLRTSHTTWSFDIATGEWSEIGSLNRIGFRAHVGQNVGGLVIAGDDETGTIWRLDPDVYDDDGVAIQRVCSAGFEARGSDALYALEIECNSGWTPALEGQGTSPVVEMRMSRDFHSWTGWAQASLGQQGRFRSRAVWRRLGIVDSPGALFQFRTTDPVPFRVSGVWANELGGGRAR